MTFDWPYYLLHDGFLYDEDGRRVYSTSLGTESIPYFASASEAEAWLEANDVRGNVR